MCVYGRKKKMCLCDGMWIFSSYTCVYESVYIFIFYREYLSLKALASDAHLWFLSVVYGFKNVP